MYLNESFSRRNTSVFLYEYFHCIPNLKIKFSIMNRSIGIGIYIYLLLCMALSTFNYLCISTFRHSENNSID